MIGTALLNLVFVGVGGFFGSIGRYLLAGAIYQIFPNLYFPVGTAVVNILGCFLIGFITEEFHTDVPKGFSRFGFLTKECIIKTGKDGSESCLRAVYVPTNNLYLGEIILVSNAEVFYTDIPTLQST